MNFMKVTWIIIFFGIAQLLSACMGGGSHQEEYIDSTNYVADYYEIRERIIKEEDKAVELREKRVTEGDTVALAPEQLKDYLPRSFDGFDPAGDFVGSPYQLSGQSYANAEQDYAKGDTHIRITLCDYNGSESQFAQETAYFASGMRIDNRRVEAGSVEFSGNLKGWEIFDKRTQRAELNIAVSDRILLKIIANQQTDTEYIKSIAKQMNLKALANL